MELVDVVDSKSTASDGVPVRVRPPAPRRRGLHIVRDDVSFKTPSLAHFVAPPFQIEPAPPGFDLVNTVGKQIPFEYPHQNRIAILAKNAILFF